MKPIDTLRTVGRPIAFYPALSKHVGGTKPCLFLCQLMYWSDRTDNKLGVYKSSEQWEEETGLSYKEQVTARKELVKRGLITETNKRLEHRIYFLFNESEFNNLIVAISSMGNSRNADRAVGEDTKGHFDPTENTTETTAVDNRSVGKKTPANRSRIEEQFDEIWPYYPKREGSNPKNRALQAFKARLKEGHTAEDMARGVARYSQYCQTKGQVGTGFVMQAQRFFGPAQEFLNDWSVSTAQQSKSSSGMIDPKDTSWKDDEWGF